MTTLTIFEPETFPHDENTLEQLKICADAGDAPFAAICADGHLGYSAPIGSAVAYKDMVSPSGVGFDIACGNKAVETDILYSEIKDDIPRIMDEIQRRISFGVGRVNNEPVDHPVFDIIKYSAPIPEIVDLLPLAEKQLGTVGAGNHYVNLFCDRDSDHLWIGVHFGSRGFGHKIASGFLAMDQGLEFDEKFKEDGMMAPPTLFPSASSIGQAYYSAMHLAGEYAYAGRDTVVEKVLEILGHVDVLTTVHNHHNYMWEETHGGEVYYVVRKGSTPLFPGQLGFVGSTMGEDSVILKGLDSDKARDALYSAPHGAGRAMSRTKAAGKWKKRWFNNVRSDNTPYETEAEALAPPEATKAKKGRVRVDPLIDYAAVKQELKEKGIELRGGAADEAPGAYKRLSEVLTAHEGALEVTNTLRPVGVCMADDKTFDPYKD